MPEFALGCSQFVYLRGAVMWVVMTALSIFSDQTVSSDSFRQSIANVELGLSVLEMTAVSYVIWGMSG